MTGFGTYLIMEFLIGTSFYLYAKKKVGNRIVASFSSFTLFVFVCLAFGFYLLYAVFRHIAWDAGGGDAYSYLVMFNNATIDLPTYFATQREEIGYKLFTWSVRQVTGNYHWYLLIVHSFLFCSFLYYSKHSLAELKGISGYIASLLTTTFLLLSFCLQRNMIALAFVLISNVKYHQQRYFPAICLAVVGMMFHSSAIIVVIAYVLLLVLKKLGRDSLGSVMRWILIAMVVELPVAYVGSVVFLPNSVYSAYSGVHGIAVGTYMMIVITACVGLYFLRNVKDIKETERNNICLAMCSLLVLPIQFFLATAYRMLLLFSPAFYCVLSHTISRSIKFEKAELEVFDLMLGAVLLLFMVYRGYTFFTADFTAYRLCPLFLDFS